MLSLFSFPRVKALVRAISFAFWDEVSANWHEPSFDDFLLAHHNISCLSFPI
jgi:enoyl-[acyl-carrier-protein] reductase (NADH)